MPNRPLKTPPKPWISKLPPLGMDAKSLCDSFRHYYNHTLGHGINYHSVHYSYTALAMCIRDRLMERWRATQIAYNESDSACTHYLSMEFLMGRALNNALLNLDIDEEVKKGLTELGVTLEELAEGENDAGLGNGGLGRLAACFLDSCATLQLPVMGYGIRYEYGMFRQLVRDGHQVEEPDHWLRNGNPWETERPEYTRTIKFGGHTEFYSTNGSSPKVRWINTHDVLAVPYDIPIPGYQNGTVNTLRLWKAAATDEFDLDEFNAGFYPESVEQKNLAENITMVLYPNDSSENGKELRLRQQYFLASASIQDVLRIWLRRHPEKDWDLFAKQNNFQLNDTHPSIAVAELMRLLMDEHNLGWDKAWEITTQTMAYTNHTLLPEALERWPVWLFERLLPRPLEIIYEINARFMRTVTNHWPGDIERMRRMSIIEEGPEPMVRMAYLAIVGSFSVNGVAALHSQLLVEGLFRDFYELWPEKFNNKTNGVTQRRWLAACNPQLKALIDEKIGSNWVYELDELRKLAPYADDPDFRARWRAVKRQNKQQLAEAVKAQCGVDFDPDALFDIQVKRMHEYKRQLLNLLHVIHLYARIKRGDTDNWTPRCVLIGGKAAPGYVQAKLIVKLINNVASTINQDPATNNMLRLVFYPNYRVTAMELICPGTDLSEQISTAGKEASGTGNMKFMMNGAITIGTLDGANIEILEEVGEENFYLFGLNAAEVEQTRKSYDPNSIIANDSNLSEVMRLLESGYFNQFEPGLFDPIINSIRDANDPWLVAADFRSFVNAQNAVAKDYLDQDQWTRMSILNTACSGKFSTDRTMREYNQEIWKMQPIPAKKVGPVEGSENGAK